MQTPFRFMPAIIYVAALFAIFLTVVLVRPTHGCGPFHIFRHHRTSQPMSCQNKETASQPTISTTRGGSRRADVQIANLQNTVEYGFTDLRPFDIR